MLQRSSPIVRSLAAAFERSGKYSRRQSRKLPLSSKRGNKHYNKGKGVPLEGRLTSKGAFVVDWKKRVNYIVPDLTGFKLKPYVEPATPKVLN